MSQIPKPLKAVIFDLDGTLIDTAQEFILVVQALRAEHGLDAMDEELIRATVSSGARALVTLSLGIEQPQETETNVFSEFESKRLRLLELYAQVLGSAATPYMGIESLLVELQEQGIVWGIVTNKPRAYAQPLMEKINLNPPPACLICPDDVRETKPHPEPLYLSCKQLDCLPHQAIYVGDHRRDIDAGRSAGMFTIAAAYGYIEPGDDPLQWGASALVETSSDLAPLILGNN